MFQPKPLASTDEISTKSKDVVDVVVLRCGSVVGIVLNIQTNQCLGNTIDDGKGPRRSVGDPKVLKVEEKGNIKGATGMPSKSSEFSPTTNNLKDFALDFSLKFGVELVPKAKN